MKVLDLSLSLSLLLPLLQIGSSGSDFAAHASDALDVMTADAARAQVAGAQCTVIPAKIAKGFEYVSSVLKGEGCLRRESGSTLCLGSTFFKDTSQPIMPFFDRERLVQTKKQLRDFIKNARRSNVQLLAQSQCGDPSQLSAADLVALQKKVGDSATDVKLIQALLDLQKIDKALALAARVAEAYEKQRGCASRVQDLTEKLSKERLKEDAANFTVLLVVGNEPPQILAASPSAAKAGLKSILRVSIPPDLCETKTEVFVDRIHDGLDLVRWSYEPNGPIESGMAFRGTYDNQQMVAIVPIEARRHNVQPGERWGADLKPVMSNETVKCPPKEVVAKPKKVAKNFVSKTGKYADFLQKSAPAKKFADALEKAGYALDSDLSIVGPGGERVPLEVYGSCMAITSGQAGCPDCKHAEVADHGCDLANRVIADTPSVGSEEGPNILMAASFSAFRASIQNYGEGRSVDDMPIEVMPTDPNLVMGQPIKIHQSKTSTLAQLGYRKCKRFGDGVMCEFRPGYFDITAVPMGVYVLGTDEPAPLPDYSYIPVPSMSSVPADFQP